MCSTSLCPDSSTLSRCSRHAAAIECSTWPKAGIPWRGSGGKYVPPANGSPSARARASASSPHGYQSTGLPACCSRYGLVSCSSRFATARAQSLVDPGRVDLVDADARDDPLVGVLAQVLGRELVDVLSRTFGIERRATAQGDPLVGILRIDDGEGHVRVL